MLVILSWVSVFQWRNCLFLVKSFKNYWIDYHEILDRHCVNVLFIYPLSKNLVTWTLKAISKNQSWLVVFGFTHTINLSCVSQVSPVVVSLCCLLTFLIFLILFLDEHSSTQLSPFCHTNKLERKKKDETFLRLFDIRADILLSPEKH